MKCYYILSLYGKGSFLWPLLNKNKKFIFIFIKKVIEKKSQLKLIFLG